MAREPYPESLCRFEAFAEPDDNHRRLYPKAKGRVVYSGVIEPTHEPMTQRQYEKFVRRYLRGFRKHAYVIRVELTWFHRYPVGEGRGPEIYFERKEAGDGP